MENEYENAQCASETTGLVPQSADIRASVSASTDASNHTQHANNLPRKSVFYKIFMVIRAYAALTSGVVLVSQIMSLAVLQTVALQVILRAYLIIFCLMFILAELQVSFFLNHAPSFTNWFQRGFMYTFVGVIGMEESFAARAAAADNELPDALANATSLILKMSSVAMVLAGALYMIMGALCLKGVWERMQERYNVRLREHASATNA